MRRKPMRRDLQPAADFCIPVAVAAPSRVAPAVAPGTGGGYLAAAWSPDALAALAARLGEGGAVLEDVPDAALLDAWAATVEAFLDPGSLERRELDPRLIPACRLSGAGLEAALAAVLGGVRRGPAAALLERAAAWRGRLAAMAAGGLSPRRGPAGGETPDLRPATVGAAPALVLGVMAGNLPALAVQTLLPVLALRRPVLLKSASAEPFFAPAFLASLVRREPRLAPACAAISWRGGDVALEAPLLAAAGTVIAYGDAAALADLRRRAGGRLIEYGPRMSLAVVAPPGAGSSGVPGAASSGVPGAASSGVPGAASSGVPGAGSSGVPGAGSPGVPGAGSPGVPAPGSSGVPALGGGDAQGRSAADRTGGTVAARLAGGPGRTGRRGAAAMGRTAPDDPAAMADLAAGLARDVALFDQRGCLSIVAVYVIGDLAAARRVAAALETALADLAVRWPPGPASAATLGAVQQVRLTAELAGLWVPPGRSSPLLPPAAGTVLVDPDPTLRPAPGPRVVRVHPLPDPSRLPGLLAPWRDRLQGAALAGAAAWDLAPALGALGLSRFAAPGELQSPDASWHNGGIDPLAALARPAGGPAGRQGRSSRDA
jgi:hypothetical protein